VESEGLAPDFANLLRQLRMSAGLTQEELAESATLSPRTVSDLERGVNVTARPPTARLLATALKLSGSARSEFLGAARGRPGTLQMPARPGHAGTHGLELQNRTLPRDISAFTGRADEFERTINAITDAGERGGVIGICAIGGMAGIGKTTLAVHAAHALAPHFPDGQIFVPLHGHTPGHRPVESADALAGLLLVAGFDAGRIPGELDARARCWRDYLADRKMLLVLDGRVNATRRSVNRTMAALGALTAGLAVGLAGDRLTLIGVTIVFAAAALIAALSPLHEAPSQDSTNSEISSPSPQHASPAGDQS
jgi:transcriptional regulator with XRE-family HTH domain